VKPCSEKFKNASLEEKIQHLWKYHHKTAESLLKICDFLDGILEFMKEIIEEIGQLEERINRIERMLSEKNDREA